MKIDDFVNDATISRTDSITVTFDSTIIFLMFITSSFLLTMKDDMKLAMSKLEFCIQIKSSVLLSAMTLDVAYVSNSI